MYRVLNEPTIKPPIPIVDTDILLKVYGITEVSEPAYLDCYLHNGSIYGYVGRMTFGLTAAWRTLIVTSTLNTPTKITNARLKLVFHPTVWLHSPDPLTVFKAKLVYNSSEYYVGYYTEEIKDYYLELEGDDPYLHDDLNSWARHVGGVSLGNQHIRYWEFDQP